jgi:hypothetical protein
MGSILATDDSGLITRAYLERHEPAPAYERVTVIDQLGRKAWSNPL